MVVLTGLPRGYRVIVALPIGYSVIVGLAIMDHLSFPQLTLAWSLLQCLHQFQDFLSAKD